MSDPLPEVSLKNTKNDIYEAYQVLLEKIKGEKQVSHQEIKQHNDEEVLVKSVTGFGVDQIIGNLADVKITIGKSLDLLEQQLVKEFRRLDDLQVAIEIETKNLEEFHQIKKQADSLAALIAAHKEYKVRFEQEKDEENKIFEQEMREKHNIWDREQTQFERRAKELREYIETQRQREDEEYNYALSLKRKKEQDEYDAKKKELERNLTEKKEVLERDWQQREGAIKTQEEEIKTLRQRVNQIDQEIEKAIKSTEKSIRETLEREHHYKVELLTREDESEKKLSQQIATSLQSKIKEQEAFIKQLTQKADDAGDQVRSIAIKAIEGASVYRGFSSGEERKKGSEGSL